MTVQAPAAKSPFSLFGVEIRIDPNVLILAAVIALNLGPDEFRRASMTGVNVWLLLTLVIVGIGISILLHEMGHTLVGRALGMKIDRITLHVFGGVAHLRSGPHTAISELLMAIAGPIVSVVLAVAFWFLAGVDMGGDTVRLAFFYLAQINLVLAIFNMVPAFPMDGGRVLRSLIWMITRNVILATSIAATLGMGFGLLLAGWGGFQLVTGGFTINSVWTIVMGLMIANIARASRPRRRATAVPPTG